MITNAQVEQAAKKLIEAEHKKFASELSNALKTGKGKPVFGREGKDKQFLLEDNQQVFTDFLGWKKSQFDKRSLVTVFQSLLSATAPKDASKKVSVKVTFPLHETEFKGQAVNKSGKAIKDVYVVTTTSTVVVEASKKGLEKSVANNNLTLNWEASMKINPKTGAVDTRSSRAVLQSILVEPSSGSLDTEIQQPQVTSETIIVEPEPEPKPAPVVVIQPEPVTVTQPAPVVVPQPVVRERGITYKVQILCLYHPVAITALPQRFRTDNVTIEKYNVEGVTLYKYVIPAGTLNEALTIRRQMHNNGIEDAWIPIYENGMRISPNEGLPELIR